jgi:hypothetical protein
MEAVTCPNCPDPRRCGCPDGRATCRTGGCSCLPVCPCRQRPNPGPGGKKWPPWWPIGCLPTIVVVVVVVVVVIITILILGGGDRGGPGDQQSVSSPTPTPLAVAPEMQQLMDEFCVEPESLAPFETTSGPDAGDSPPPLGSADPALDVEQAGLYPGGCGEDAGSVWVFLAELGGPPEGMQLGLALDTDPAAGFTPTPGAPDGLGRAGEWDQVVFVNADGSTMFYDSAFRPLDSQGDLSYQRNGKYLAFAFHERLLQGVIAYYFQIFVRDGATGSSPVDWTLATGMPQPR